MSCAACQARVEKAVSGVPGVTECSVSLLTNSMGVSGTADEKEIIKAVTRAGYGAKKRGKKGVGDALSEEEEALKDRESPVLKKRLISSLLFLFILMYFSMGHMMLNLPVPPIFENHVCLGMLEMLLSIIIMMINGRFFINGFKSLFALSPNMDTLVALGSSAAFAYSTVVLFIMSYAMGMGDSEAVMKYSMDLYFESAAMIPALITVGKLLEAISKGRTTDALKDLIRLRPKTARVMIDGEEREIPASELSPGDLFFVKPGDSIPVDAVVTGGVSAVDEALLTGESIPVDKAEGDRVSQATINRSGVLYLKAEKTGNDSALSEIIRMVSDAAATKAPIARIADRVSAVFVPGVIAIALIVLVIWLLLGQSFTFALARAISVLVISCPCALGLATPVAIMAGSGVGARNGILFKNAAGLEMAGRIEIVALDKTGTITEGKPVVDQVITAEGVEEEDLIFLAASLERNSEHPLSVAIMEYAEKKGIKPGEVEDFRIFPGNGLSAVYKGQSLFGGNPSFVREHSEEDKKLFSEAERLSEEGRTPLFFGRDRSLIGMIAVSDVIREDSVGAVAELRNMGIETVMLTGDNIRTAEAIGRETGVDTVRAEVKPDDKAGMISKLKERGRTAMTGDGINDAPALAKADLGIAIGAGTDVAIDSASVVLMKNSVRDVPAAIRLGRSTLKIIHENLFWAFFYNVICIPLAAGAYIRLFNWEMNPMVGAAAMAMSSFTVCMNALRLNLVDIYDPSGDKKRKTGKNNIKRNEEGKEEKMTKTINIEGMMCPHCEANVRGALEALEGVSKAEVSHETGKAVVTLEKEVDEGILKKAVEDKNYSVVSFE